MIEVGVDLDSVTNRVYTKSYYIGESVKPRDADVAIVQASSDNLDEIHGYIKTGVIEVGGKMVKRMKEFDLSDDFVISIIPYNRLPDNWESVVKLLKIAIEDYLVEFASYQWIKTTRPDLCEPLTYNLPLYMSKVETYIGMLSGRMRRRYSVFGI